jgi:hypothetical protein
MTNAKTWTVVIQEEGEDLILPLPQEMLDEVGWKLDDKLEWHNKGDGTWEIQKKQEQSDRKDF